MKKVISALIVILYISNTAIAQKADGGIRKGDMAPEFKSTDQNGKPIILKEELKKGPVVLVFYRGEWCPYCNKQLKRLEDSLSYITQKGASVIAISPEKQENVAKTVSKTNATYSIVSDDHLKIMNAYKVAFALNKKKTALHKLYGVDLDERNGTNGNNLPVPAMYIIGTDGKITYRYYDTDFRKRVSIREIVSHL